MESSTAPHLELLPVIIAILPSIPSQVSEITKRIGAQIVCAYM